MDPHLTRRLAAAIVGVDLPVVCEVGGVLPGAGYVERDGCALAGLVDDEQGDRADEDAPGSLLSSRA